MRATESIIDLLFSVVSASYCRTLTISIVCENFYSFLILLNLGKNMEKQSRQSNFEFLRILSIAMIVAFHSIYFTKFSFGNEISTNKLLYDVLYYCGELGVNCFILIGGYFLPVATFRWKKLALMILQIYSLTVICLLIITF